MAIDFETFDEYYDDRMDEIEISPEYDDMLMNTDWKTLKDNDPRWKMLDEVNALYDLPDSDAYRKGKFGQLIDGILALAPGAPGKDTGCAFGLLRMGYHNEARKVFEAAAQANRTDFLAWWGLVECEARAVRAIRESRREFDSAYGVYWVETMNFNPLHFIPGAMYLQVETFAESRILAAAEQAVAFAPPACAEQVRARMSRLVFDAKRQAQAKVDAYEQERAALNTPQKKHGLFGKK